MTKIEDIKEAVSQLSPEELKAFQAWFEEMKAKLWDDQIERDVKSGKLDWLFDEAVTDYEARKSKKLG